MRLLLSLFTFLLFTTSCQYTLREESREFSIEGNFENAENISIQIQELTPQDLQPLDTVYTDDEGRFSLTQPVTEAGFYIVRVDNNNFVTLLIEPGESIRIQGDASDLATTCEIKGSPGSNKLAYLNTTIADNFRKVDSLANKFQNARFDPDFNQIKQQLDVEYTRIFEAQQSFIKSFIDKNSRSLASIIALYKYFGNQLILNEREHFDYFEKVSLSLSDTYPDNKHVMDLKRRVNEQRRNEMQRKRVDASLSKGNPAPEIVLPDPQGNMIALSSLKGNVVLIDFWAAWCPPCRQANINLRELYDEFRNEGFEIYGISLDRTREQWIAGIKEDNVSWTQVSDLRFWNSPVVSLYNVEGIPHSLLIDKEGKIVARNPGLNELKDLLDEMLR